MGVMILNLERQVWCAPILEAMNLLIASSLAALALLGLLNRFQRRLQGFTGDCLGTAQQVCEIAFYLGLAISL